MLLLEEHLAVEDDSVGDQVIGLGLVQLVAVVNRLLHGQDGVCDVGVVHADGREVLGETVVVQVAALLELVELALVVLGQR